MSVLFERCADGAAYLQVIIMCALAACSLALACAPLRGWAVLIMDNWKGED